MKHTQTCPKCAGRKFAVTPEFRQPDHEAGNMTWALPAITISLFEHEPDVASRGGRAFTGRFETWICLGCGYTEFYAHGIDLDEIAKRRPDRLRIIDAGPPENGPYR